MKQMSLGATGFERKTKRMRKRENRVVPSDLMAFTTPHAPARSAKGGRLAFPVETLLRIHFLQQWFNQVAGPHFCASSQA
jgi:IS5 family transposase